MTLSVIISSYTYFRTKKGPPLEGGPRGGWMMLVVGPVEILHHREVHGVGGTGRVAPCQLTQLWPDRILSGRIVRRMKGLEQPRLAADLSLVDQTSVGPLEPEGS